MTGLLTSSDVAKLVGIKLASVYAARRRGAITPATILLGRPLYDPAAVRETWKLPTTHPVKE